MRWKDGFIAVDWGTTNRRAYRLNGAGDCVDSFEDGRGILSVHSGGFQDAAAEIRRSLGDFPLLLAGMVGSSRGWVEVPYQPCPTGLHDLSGVLQWIEPDIAIVPGLSVIDGGRADVMRGEEVQLFGAVAAGSIPASSFVGHPGTHNKWVTVDGGRIINFRTVMTGELFGSLRDRGMLAEVLTGEVVPGRAFNEGVQRGLEGTTLTAELFSVRAGYLLGTRAREDAASFVSGLLIGADVAVGAGLADGGTVFLMGDPDLTGLYAAAAGIAGLDIREVDGEKAFLAGARAIGESIE